MDKQQKLQELQDQLESIQQQIVKLKEPETFYAVVHSATPSNWYNVGDVYKVCTELTKTRFDGNYHALVNDTSIGVAPDNVTKILDNRVIALLDAVDVNEKN